MIDKAKVFESILDSLKEPVLFVDTEHVIQYGNNAAVAFYPFKKKDLSEIVGKSIFDSHKEKSNQIILEVFESMQNGEEERLVLDNAEMRLYMRAVRDKSGVLLGYYERFEPPKKPARDGVVGPR